MVALNGLQVHETADSQPLLVALSLIDHSKNMRGKNLPCLEHDGPITLLKLLVNGKSAFDSFRSGVLFHQIRIGLIGDLSDGPDVDASCCGFHRNTLCVIGAHLKRTD
jgi:hypothetical protein